MFPEKILKRFQRAHYRPRTYKNDSDLVMVQVPSVTEDGCEFLLTQFVHQDAEPSAVVDSHVFDKSRILETGMDKQLTTKFSPVLTLDGVDMALDSYGMFKNRVDEQIFIDSLMSKPDSKPDSKPVSKPDSNPDSKTDSVFQP